MHIRIKEKPYEYTPDFPEGWKFSRGDYYKFPVTIGTNNCFIKRFEKRTDAISGWSLLMGLCEEFEPNLSRVYYAAKDIDATTNASVTYVFYEYIEGKVLHELIARKVPVDMTKLTDGLFAALQTLEKRGYWFPDFFEKNMFVGKNGNFLLIDLDSAYPLKDLPDNEMWGSKDYWALVFKFCKEVLKLSDIKPADFYGPSFNYLHAVFLIFRIKICYFNESIEYDDVAFFNQLPHYLNSISPVFRKVFAKVCEKGAHPLEIADINELKELVYSTIIPLSDTDFNGTVISSSPAQPAVVIDSFTVINYIELQGDAYIIGSSNTFKLKWEVENAKEIELYKNGRFLQRFDNDQKSIDLTEELPDDQAKKIEYRLSASYELVRVEKALIVEIVPPASKPGISNFRLEEFLDKNDECYLVESGRDFKLQWDVGKAKTVELLKNGSRLMQFINGENSIILNEEAWDGKERIINYTLIVSGGEGSVETEEHESLKIKLLYQQQDIESFTVKSYLEKNAEGFIVESGRPFTLGWDLTTARAMEILKNGLPFKTVPPDQNNVSVTENLVDGNTQKVIYTLVSPATESTNKSSRSVTVVVKPAAPVPPVIKKFIASKTVIRGSGFFKLSWEVEHVSRVALYKNGIFYKEFEGNETSLELQENYEGSIKHLRYSLHAANDVESVRSETVNVDVKAKINVAKFVGIVAALLTATAIIYFFILRLNPADKTTINTAGFDKIVGGDTMTITGSGIPENEKSIAVNFNDVTAPLVDAKKDSIRVIVPQLPADTIVNITVFINSKPYAAANQLPYKRNTLFGKPLFDDLSGITIIQNETVTIKGKNLPTTPGAIQLFMNKVPVKIIQQTADSIRILVPELKDKIVNVNAVIDGTGITLADNLTYQKNETVLIETIINPFNESMVTEGDIITIFGSNIPKRKADVKVQFNNAAASIIQLSGKSIKVQVPSLQKDVSQVDITVAANGRVFKAGSNIAYQSQQVTIFATSQNKITEGENLFISGKNIPTAAGSVTVLFNNVRGRITGQEPTLIQVVIPSLPPNTRQADVIVQVNGREQLVASNVTYQPLRAFVNVCEQAILSSETFKTGFLRLGNKHVELSMKNSSKFTMDEVIVAIHYVQKNGEKQTEEISFSNVPPGVTVNKRSNKDIKNATVKFEVKSVATKEFGLQKCRQ